VGFAVPLRANKPLKTIMTHERLIIIPIMALAISCGTGNNKPQETADTTPTENAATKHLFLDVHNLEPGKVTFAAVADAHQKDLATQDKYGVNYIKYWVDEKAGKVYCLAESADSASLYKTHQEAHGLVPDLVHQVSDGPEAKLSGRTLFLDIHRLGAGNVTEEAVAGAHTKDLAVQGKYNVNFINYWVDPKQGVVMCLSEANDTTSIVNTHKEAHGLLPAEIHRVQQGQ
jgi:hypothetical protein